MAKRGERREKSEVDRAAALSGRVEELRVTLHSIGHAVVTTDARGAVDYLNPAAEILTGWSMGGFGAFEMAAAYLIAHAPRGQVIGRGRAGEARSYDDNFGGLCHNVVAE